VVARRQQPDIPRRQALAGGNQGITAGKILAGAADPAAGPYRFGYHHIVICGSALSGDNQDGSRIASRELLPICGRPLRGKGKRRDRGDAWSDAAIWPASGIATRMSRRSPI
jgi:hypothetical protein